MAPLLGGIDEMCESAYSKAVDAAKATTTALGHRVRFEVRDSAARGKCDVCNAIGLAIEMPCKNGEDNVAPSPEAPKPGGTAVRPTVAVRKPRTARQATAMPSYDDVPFPDMVPATARR